MQHPQITVLTKQGGIMSKHIRLAPGGGIDSDSSSCGMWAGTARRDTPATASALAGRLGSCGSDQAIALGCLPDHIPDDVQVVTKRELASHPGAIARTRDFIDYREGAPGWMLIDVDTKGMPRQVAERIQEAGGPWPFICQALPALANAEHVIRASTSAGLYNADTGEDIEGSGGQHIYVKVADSSDIRRSLENLHDRCWSAGAGWHLLGKAGQLLERSPVDRSVSGPERLVFEGAPILEHPLAQHKEMRRPVPHNGATLDSRLALPLLDVGEQAHLDQLRNESARALGKEANTIRRRFVEEHAAKIAAKHNLSPKVARRLVSGVHHQVLSPYHELELDDLDTATVRAVLDDPENFVGLTLADPIEGIAYGRCKAKIMRGDDGLLFIHSFAHGRTFYRLRYDLKQAEAALERAQDMDDVAEIAAASQLEADEREHFIKSVARKTGLKQPAIKKRLKDDAERRRRARRPAEGAGSADHRAQRQCPPMRGALSGVVADLDRILESDLSRSPPMRNTDGRLVEVRVAPPEGLHMIAGASGPAAEPTIHALSATGIQMLIEKYACFLANGREGPYEAALPLPFIDGLNDYQNTKLPLIRAINTAPVVADDGTLVDGDGLDRKTGLFHFIDPDLRKCLPQTTPTDDEVIEAMRFLCEEWLVDVAADLQGKFAVILLVLTLIQRALLDARPAFFISAGIPKAGKTTLAQMCSMAVFGHSASGANWSDQEEERRKALFSFLRQGVRLVLWDNIRRGAEISCPHIEKSLTEYRMADRVLSYSRVETVPTNTIQVFTGNRIKPKGDMCSRSFTITLDAGRPDPEARLFAHPDPLQWTRANRLRIIKACYTLLVAGVRCRPADIAARTRFKTWWKLVGWPVEHAASCTATRSTATP